MRNKRTPRPASIATRRALARARFIRNITFKDKQRIAKEFGIHVATLYRALAK